MNQNIFTGTNSRLARAREARWPFDTSHRLPKRGSLGELLFGLLSVESAEFNRGVVFRFCITTLFNQQFDYVLSASNRTTCNVTSSSPCKPFSCPQFEFNSLQGETATTGVWRVTTKLNRWGENKFLSRLCVSTASRYQLKVHHREFFSCFRFFSEQSLESLTLLFSLLALDCDSKTKQEIQWNLISFLLFVVSVSVARNWSFAINS